MDDVGDAWANLEHAMRTLHSTGSAAWAREVAAAATRLAHSLDEERRGK